MHRLRRGARTHGAVLLQDQRDAKFCGFPIASSSVCRSYRADWSSPGRYAGPQRIAYPHSVMLMAETCIVFGEIISGIWRSSYPPSFAAFFMDSLNTMNKRKINEHKLVFFRYV